MTFVKFKNSGMGNFPTISRSLGFPVFNENFDRFLNEEAVNWMPSANIKERTGDFRIDLAVPGMDKKDFKIEVEESILTISGERREEAGENEKNTRREFHYGTFRRSFSLPETADAEKISASYNNGLLSVTIGKREEAKQTKKEISIS